MESLSSKRYKNEFVANFPGDETGDKTPRQTPGKLYSKVTPTPVAEPVLVAWSEDLAAELDMAPPTDADTAILGGNTVTEHMQPYAACYAGHQFGSWAGQLGDGRAITLGEWEKAPGQSYELQLKGAGPTPYSRRADGRAVLRSSVREYLMSEAMHHLGIPTTRALSLVATSEPVLRDMFYNGNAAHEPGAIVARVAPSFLRFGNFELLAARQELDHLQQLTDWTITRYFPHLQQQENKLLAWFQEVVERTAKLMVEWMRVGFVHGVMNTDNMSILGLTIDYGPYSFVDDYDPDFTPNTTDLPGRRYAFGKQASVAYWNLGCLAGALAPLLPDKQELVKVLETYKQVYWQNYYAMMGRKLGLHQVSGEDIQLIRQLEEVMAKLKPDMTIFFQLLIELPLQLQNAETTTKYFADSLYRELTSDEAESLYAWLQQYTLRLQENTFTREVSQAMMRRANPRFILRNYLLHQAIEQLEQSGDASLFRQLEQAIKEPYSTKHDTFFAKRPDWATQKAGCSMLSCSS